MRTSTTIDTECPRCSTIQRAERNEDGSPDLVTMPCCADDCTARLCRHCEQFECVGCGLTHCLEHGIRSGAGLLCPVCGAAPEMATQDESELVAFMARESALLEMMRQAGISDAAARVVFEHGMQ